MRYRKPDHCPQCRESQDLRLIIRGLPSEEGLRMLLEQKAVPGSFIAFADMPQWQCGCCEHQFSDETDPLVARERRFEQRFLGCVSDPPTPREHRA